MEQGGLLMWPLLILGVAGFFLAVERALYLNRCYIRADPFLAGIKNLLRKRRLLEALTLCEETPGPVAGVVKAGLLQFDQDEYRMKSAIQASALVEVPLLQRRIGSIAAIARIAPLIGLLGTIVALYGTFSILEATEDYVQFSSLMGGLKAALVTTAVGIGIAILAHAVHQFLHERVLALLHDMEYVGNELMQFLLRDLPDEDSSDAVAEEEEEEEEDMP